MIVIICAIGTAKITPINHIITPAHIIDKKISKGFTPIVFFITSGIKILFSNRWRQKYQSQTTSNPLNPNIIVAIKTAGIAHNKGHI
jgi:hypothetical protein